MNTGRPEPHTLAGAYALDALSGADRARFERHLARCAECAREVSGLREATARLAMAAAAPPPAALKDALRARTARTRQLPPVTGEARRAGARRARSRSWAPRLAALLAGATAVATAAVVLVLTGTGGPPPQQPAAASQEIAAVLTAPDATRISVPVRTGGTAAVVMSRREHMLVFAAAGLRVLPHTQCYELWLLGPHTDRPAGVLPMPRHGMTGPVVAAGLRPGDRLALAVEPAMGPARPGPAMILVLAL